MTDEQVLDSESSYTAAQDVIDALRLALAAQDDPHKALPVIRVLLDYAPQTDGNRGAEILIGLISEARLSVHAV